MAFKKNELEFESDKVKVYVQQIQAVNGILTQQLDQLKKELDITNCVNIEFSLKVKKYEEAIDEITEIADNNYENPEMERIFNIIGGLDV